MNAPSSIIRTLNTGSLPRFTGTNSSVNNNEILPKATITENATETKSDSLSTESSILLQRVFEQKLAIANNRVTSLEKEFSITEKDKLIPTNDDGSQVSATCSSKQQQVATQKPEDIKLELTYAKREVEMIKNEIQKGTFTKESWQNLDTKIAELNKGFTDELVSVKQEAVNNEGNIPASCSEKSQELKVAKERQELAAKEVTKLKETITQNSDYYSLTTSNLQGHLAEAKIDEKTLDRDLMLKDIQNDTNQVYINERYSNKEDPTLTLDKGIAGMKEAMKQPSLTAEDRATIEADIQRLSSKEYREKEKAKWQRQKAEATSNITTLNARRDTKMSSLKQVMNEITATGLQSASNRKSPNTYTQDLSEFQKQLKATFTDKGIVYKNLGNAQNALVQSMVHLNSTDKQAYKDELQSIISSLDSESVRVASNLMNMNSILAA